MAAISLKSRYLSEIQVSDLKARYRANGYDILRYYMDFHHKGLDLHKEVSAPELSILQNKINALLDGWDKKRDQSIARNNIQTGKVAADEMTVDALNKLSLMDQLLNQTLKVNDAINWSALRDNTSFSVPQPIKSEIQAPERETLRLQWFDHLFGFAARKRRKAEVQHQDALRAWEKVREEADRAHQRALKEWSREADSFVERQRSLNDKVDAFERAVSSGVGEERRNAVIEHASLVLDSSNYYDFFEKSFSIDYDDQQKLLLIEFELPSPELMPVTKSVRFIQATGELKETQIPLKQQKDNFEAACYKISLRTIHEVFEADVYGNIDKVLFNGFATSVNKATGKDTRSCILSVLVDRAEFIAIDLARVEPKACFKALKGVSGASLAALSPIEPVMKMNKSDRRFVDAKEVISALPEATNLAAMDWEEFEHLVRELFEAEFKSRGGEVKVTRASSDGGVDAIAFDPDPITGGKIVIQAKRYTKTVGVAAIRDLYGTTINEGASRGILVTTADYGPDAYKFAADKPLTLLTGANLLHMLQKHGFKATIDLTKARQQLGLVS